MNINEWYCISDPEVFIKRNVQFTDSLSAFIYSAECVDESICASEQDRANLFINWNFKVITLSQFYDSSDLDNPIKEYMELLSEVPFGYNMSITIDIGKDS